VNVFDCGCRAVSPFGLSHTIHYADFIHDLFTAVFLAALLMNDNLVNGASSSRWLSGGRPRRLREACRRSAQSLGTDSQRRHQVRYVLFTEVRPFNVDIRPAQLFRPDRGQSCELAVSALVIGKTILESELMSLIRQTYDRRYRHTDEASPTSSCFL
jgi:hypothetical protein